MQSAPAVSPTGGAEVGEVIESARSSFVTKRGNEAASQLGAAVGASPEPEAKAGATGIVVGGDDSNVDSVEDSVEEHEADCDEGEEGEDSTEWSALGEHRGGAELEIPPAQGESSRLDSQELLAALGRLPVAAGSEGLPSAVEGLVALVEDAKHPAILQLIEGGRCAARVSTEGSASRTTEAPPSAGRGRMAQKSTDSVVPRVVSTTRGAPRRGGASDRAPQLVGASSDVQEEGSQRDSSDENGRLHGGQPMSTARSVNSRERNRQPRMPVQGSRTVVAFDNGDEYDGGWREGLMHGYGVYRYANGDVYTGQWVEGQRSGDGRIVYAASAAPPSSAAGNAGNTVHEEYDGEWLNDSIHGRGVYKFSSGSQYEGQWVRGRMEGQGKYLYGDGNIYEGECVANLREGYGVFHHRDGSHYEGQWKSDQPHGVGRFTSMAGGEYFGEWFGGRVHGQGTYTYKSGRVYEGAWTKDKRHGIGVLTFPDGSKYEGGWRDDEPHGRGAFHVSKGGLTYEGEWLFGKLSGRGILKEPQHGVVFDGLWKDNQREGFGVLFCPRSGIRYEGMWSSGKPHGEGRISRPSPPNRSSLLAPKPPAAENNQADDFDEDLWVLGRSSARPSLMFTGTDFVVSHSEEDVAVSAKNFWSPDETLKRLATKKAKRKKQRGNSPHADSDSDAVDASQHVSVTLSDGSTYEGSWLVGKPCGFGRYRNKTGSVFHGEWQDGVMHGRGRYSYSDGSVYIGQCRSGEKTGFGLFVSAQNVSYEGEWLADKPHGVGVLLLPSGVSYDGNWDNGSKSGFGRWRYEDNSIYEGNWVDDQKEGRGVMTYSDGRRYDGEWKKGKGEGRGTYVTRRGSVYDGEWQNGLMHGAGQYAYSGGSVYVGSWRHNRKDGEGVLRFADGALYEGFWLRDKAHGKGTLTSVDGVTYTGIWVEGELKGKAKGLPGEFWNAVPEKNPSLDRPEEESGSDWGPARGRATNSCFSVSVAVR